MGQLLQFSYRLDLEDDKDRRTLLHTIERFQGFCSHYESAELENVSPFRSLVSMLIGDGDMEAAVEIICLWNTVRLNETQPDRARG